MRDLKNLKESLKSVVSDRATPELKLNDDTVVKALDALKGFNRKKLEEQFRFLQEAVATLKSPRTYKFLSKLFAETDEKTRQKYFHALLDWFFNELTTLVLPVSLERPTFEREVKILLPLVKLEAILRNPGDEELVRNVQNYFSSPRLNQEDIYQAVQTYLGNSQYDLQSFELIPLDQRNGHLGDYFQLKILIRHHNELITLDWFAKFLVPHSEYFKQILARGPSKKEEFFYMQYLPKLKRLGLSELLDFAPNCYFSRVNDVLILDDVSAEGFIGLSPHTQLSLDQLKLTLKQLAKLHACSFIFENALGRAVFDLYGEYLSEVIFYEGSSEMNESFARLTETILYINSILPDKYSESELRIKANNWCKVTMDKLARPSGEHVNVICHGDAYVANMLFKFADNKAVEAIKLIDFQLLKYQPPMLEVLFFLYQNSSKETLDGNLDTLYQGYYENLSEILQKYNLDVQKVLPRAEFDQSREPMTVLALYMSMYYSSVCALGPELRQDLLSGKFNDSGDDMLVVKSGMKTENFKRVMTGLFERFIELCDKNMI